MKFILFIFLLVPNFLFAQQNGISIKYRLVYNYLNCRENLKKIDVFLKKLPESNFPINVMPEIYPISLMFFDKEVIKSRIMTDSLKKENIGTFIRLYDKNNYFNPYLDTTLLNIFPYNDKSQIYIVFSKSKNGLLLTNMYIDYYGVTPRKINDLPKFGTYYKLLFLFNDKNKIIHFYSTKVNQ